VTGTRPSLLDRLRRLTRWRTPPPRVRGVLLVVAVGLFVTGVVLSLRELELDLATVSWWPLVLVAVLGTPATIAANAAELRAMARLSGAASPPSWPHAARVVIVATAANLLPLPGGALVRVHALRTAGAGLATATVVTLLAAWVWVATAVGVAGVAAFAWSPVTGLTAFAVASVALVLAAVVVRTSTSRWSLPALAELAVVELITTLVHAARLYLVLLALGVAASLPQALVLGAGAPLASAAGIFPAGLGLAELLTALLAPVVALPAAVGFAVAALARVIGLLATIPVALLLGVRDLVPPTASAIEDGPGTSGGSPA
jgi:hypothetical protein